VGRIDNSQFYHDSLQRHGDTAKALHWNNEYTQIKRFEVLHNLIDDELSHATLVDAGCGFADFYTFLERHGNLPQKYIGLDLMPDMVLKAKEKMLDKKDVEIFESDICHDTLPEADYYVCSGGMNILKRFETNVFITRCFEASNKAFVFNLLLGADDSMVYNYYLPAEIKKIAKTLGAEVEIVQNYLPRDFSVKFVKKSV
jgi:SAM-dependent methyltransferase